MLSVSILAVVVALACSVLSRSALQWSAYVAAGLCFGRFLGSNDLHSYLFVVDAAILIAMIGSYTRDNRVWQELVAMLQSGILAIYAAYALLGNTMLWLTIPLIDVANLAFIAQAAILALGGLRNSQRNYHYAKARKQSGDKTSFLILAWRAT